MSAYLDRVPICKRCGRRNPIGFRVRDEDWLAVAGAFTLLCPTCFDELADQKNIAYTFIELFPVSWSGGRDEENADG